MRIAIHVCTGDRGAEAAVDLWLERDGFRVRRFEDVYAACAHLATHRGRPPELVVLGASWLTRDELAIIGYFERTWPAVPLVVYGFPADVGGIDLSPNVRVCRSSSELRGVLDKSPSAWLSAGSAPRANSTGSVDRDNADDAFAREPDDTAMGPHADNGNTNGVPRADANTSNDPTESPRLRTDADPVPRRALSEEVELTREELAALLEDSDR